MDKMLIETISIAVDIDKQLINYVKRAKQWYGWHFPELNSIVMDNNAFIKTVLAIGMRMNVSKCDLSDILTEKMEAKVKEMAEKSNGIEISDEIVSNINNLCQIILELEEYRTKLHESIINQMMTIAPNLSILVGELIGARLIAKVGSLLNLAKLPASKVQILGAEKAMFRSFKKGHNTPKYGIIYDAPIIQQSNDNIKGKMARLLAVKCSLASRIDAFGDRSNNEFGIKYRTELEAKLKFLEEECNERISRDGKRMAKVDKCDGISHVMDDNDVNDLTIHFDGISIDEEHKANTVKEVETELPLKDQTNKEVLEVIDTQTQQIIKEEETNYCIIQ